jgi:hypothetical protein
MVKLYGWGLSLLLVIILHLPSFAQNGKLSGRITDKDTKEPIPFATVRVFSGGQLKGGAQADIDGVYMVSPLVPGTYDVEFSSVGYNKQTVSGVVINFETTTRFDFKLTNINTQLPAVEIVYEADLVSKDETSTGAKLTAKDIEKIPTRNINAIIQTQAAVYSADDGAGLNIRGNREGDNAVFINGIRQFGTRLPPVESIAELSIITGGVPAQYGDALGGIISITTKGAASKFSGNVQGETSSLFDKWHYNFAGTTLSGPLLQTKGGQDENGVYRDKRTLLGFFSALQFTTNADAVPSPFGVYVPTDAARRRVLNGEVVKFGNAYRSVADFFTPADMRRQTFRPNASDRLIQFNTNLDFQPSEDIVFTLGGNINSSKSNLGGYFNPFNYQNNAVNQRTDLNVFGRFRQSFKNIGGDSSLLKNVYYQVQVDYTSNISETFDPRFKKDFNKYNYTGIFEPIIGPYTVPEISPFFPGGFFLPRIIDDSDPTNLVVRIENLTSNENYQYVVNGSTLGFRYVPTSLNPELSAFNRSIANTFTETLNPFEFFLRGGIPNGFANDDFNEMGYRFPFAGRASTNYAIGNQTQFRVSGQVGADIKRHSFKFGFEYEQRTIASYRNTNFLYDRARLLTNTHILSADQGLYLTFDTTDAPDGRKLVTVDFRQALRKNSQGEVVGQTAFDKALRARLGLPQYQSINIDGITPDQFSIKDFSISEIFDDGRSPLARWQGYDPYGNRLRGRRPSFNNFFRDTLTRGIDAFRPNYLAFFIEDKFEINDLIVRIGLRVDRFDANQPVPIDKYSFTRLRTVGETDATQFRDGDSYRFPGNVGSDWAIYVDRPSETFAGNQRDFTVLGFRNGDRWYNRNGQEIDNPQQVLAVNGRVNPWFDISQLRDAEQNLQRNTGITLDAFRDFKPQWNFLPRVAFSFPISEEATFFAHYDVLTQRPLGVVPGAGVNDAGDLAQNFASPFDYYRLRLGGSDFLHNPNLKPQRKIDYQLGFQQALTSKSAIKLSAFYSEIKDLIQVFNVINAYPVQYKTNENIDFSTVKGFTVQYDLRRSSNFTINTSYTLQFADGSASNFANALLNTSQPNLRNTVPQNFDQRHAIKINLDYRFKKGEGPEILGTYPLQNMGINTTFFTGSGTPFTRDGSPQGGRFQIKGQINGDRLPWNNRTSLRIDKSYTFKKEDSKKEQFLNVYLYITNLFDARNVLGVYARTGSPTDDGFLASDFGRNTAQNQPSPETFAYFYNMTIVNPNNISLPRRFRLGASYNF